MQSEIPPAGRKRSFIEQARRAQILEAATELVAEIGYANVSLSRIAERAGVSKSVISYHFDGKNELLAQIAGEFFEDAWAYMEPRIEAAPSAAAKVATWIESECEYFAAHRTRYLAMSDVSMNHRDPDGTRSFDMDEAEELDALTEIIEMGQLDGEFGNFDARESATVIVRAMVGIMGTWQFDDTVDLAGEGRMLSTFVRRSLEHPPIVGTHSTTTDVAPGDPP